MMEDFMFFMLGAVFELLVFVVGWFNVVVGGDYLDYFVCWVHVVEVVDISELLRGDELIFIIGVVLFCIDDGIVGFVWGLVELLVVGFVVELGCVYNGCLSVVMVWVVQCFGMLLVEFI